MIEKAIFGGGCFWCTEAVFKMLKGVKKVLPGYAGGTKEDATYEKVSTGTTDHAEVTYVEYDPNLVSYDTLLTIFFASHDPYSVNRQGNDIGRQYRSAVFYTNEEQKTQAGKVIKDLGAVTELEPLKEFFEAESYHHDYFSNNSEAPYCQLVINPKLDKIKEKFSNLLKSQNNE